MCISMIYKENVGVYVKLHFYFLMKGWAAKETGNEY